jgi:hypothetical protein
MVSPSFKERLRRVPIAIREWLFMLGARKDTPRNWFSGSYSRIKLVRVSLVIAALLNYSAFAQGSNYLEATFTNLWYGLVYAGYIIVSMIFLFGLRMWYGPAIAFTILNVVINLMINFAGGPFALGTTANPAFAYATALIWTYTVVVGLLMMHYDKGSKINEMLQQS